MAITITIANEKGGVGKTTTAVNLAAGIALRIADHAKNANRVLLVDMDPQVHALLAVAYENHQNTPPVSLAALLTESPPPSIQRLIQRNSQLSSATVDQSVKMLLEHMSETLAANPAKLRIRA